MMSLKNPTHENIQAMSPEIQQTLKAIFEEDIYATKAIQYTLKRHSDWKDRKRAVFAEVVYDLVRWWRSLWFILNQAPSLLEKDIQRLIALYIFWKQADRTVLEKQPDFHLNQIMQRIMLTNSVTSLRESIPDWLDGQGQQELPLRWDTVLAALNKPAQLIIRVNTLKTSREKLIEVLFKENLDVEPITISPDALHIKQKINVFALKSHQQGLFEVQDAASQNVCRILNPQPGMRIVDACAGEGSKTLHLAALIKNKGKIIALDTQQWRLNELRKRAKKAGADTIETRMITSSKTYKRMQQTADRLLLDVPCSGLGTLRRNPDIKWKLTEESMQRLRRLQQDLLSRYCAILKPDGQMVYSVCSIFPSEGEAQIQQFLASHHNYSLLYEKRYWPDSDGTDGFFIALLQRTS